MRLLISWITIIMCVSSSKPMQEKEWKKAIDVFIVKLFKAHSEGDYNLYSSMHLSDFHALTPGKHLRVGPKSQTDFQLQRELQSAALEHMTLTSLRWFCDDAAYAELTYDGLSSAGKVEKKTCVILFGLEKQMIKIASII